MALTRVQATGKVIADGTASIALTFASPPSVGNGIAVAVTLYFHSALPTPTCADNQGNSYTLAREGALGGPGRVAIFYCPAISTSGAPFTVTVSASGGTYFVASALEVGGVGTGLVLDAAANAYHVSAATVATGATAALTADEALFVAVCSIPHGIGSITVEAVSPSWTQEHEDLSFSHAVGEGDSRLVTGVVGLPASCSWTLSASGQWNAAIAAFGAPASTASVPDVVGETEADASTAITAAGLTIGTITTAVSSSVPAGHVISQSPAAGTTVPLGSAVDLVIAVAAGLVVLINGEAWTFRHDSMSIVSTLNGRDTLSGIIDILDGADPPTLNQEITAEEDGVRIYGGTINELEYRAITSDPDASQDLMVSLSAEDFNALADKRTVPSLTGPEGLTLKQALQQLMPELTPFGITLSPTQVDGPVLPSFTFTLQTGTAILDELSKLTEFVWEIDYTKVLTMWQPGSVAAPFNITDSDRTVWGDIVIRPIASDYANRIIVRTAGEGPSETVFAWYTDGTTNHFPMYYYVLQHFGQVLVDTPLETVPGEGFESVGAPGSGALWEFHDGPRYTQYLSRTAGAPPTGNLRPTVPYPLQFRVLYENPIVVTADDLVEQAANGIVEKLVTVDGTGSWWELQAYADALLTRHAARRYTIQYSTREKGLRVGQSQTLTIARRHLSGPYFITDVDTQMIGATILKRTITANETELFQGSWRDTYKLWAGNSGGGGGGASTIGTTVPLGTPGPHHAQHEPGGMDPLTVDSTASVGSLRTLGTGANQAAPGNDARFSTPALHHATHEPGGTDTLQLTATSRVLGRATAGAGAVEELTLGDNLYLTGTTLSAASRNSAFVNYSYSTATSAPPGADQIRFNAGAPYTAVTKVWIRTVTADGQDVYRGLLIVPSGSTILVQDKNDHTQYVQFTTTGTPVDNTTYVEFPVTHQAHGSSLGGGQLVIVQNTGGNLGGGLSTQQKTRTIIVVFGTGSAAITAGLKTFVSCPYTGTITAARLLVVDASVTSGSIVIDVQKDTYTNYPPTGADSICGSAKPTLVSATKSEDTTLTGWTPAVTAGDVFGFVVDSASGVTQVALQLTIVVS